MNPLPNDTEVTINGQVWKITGAAAGMYLLAMQDGKTTSRTALQYAKVQKLVDASKAPPTPPAPATPPVVPPTA